MANVVSDAMYNQLKQLYGGDAGKASKAKAQVESGYSADQYNQLVSKLNSMYGSGASSTPANAQKAQTASQSTYDAQQQKSNQIIQQKQDNLNQLNALSSQVAQNNSRNFQVGTGDVAEMPEQPKVSSVQQPTQDKFAKSWANMTAAQQQAALTKKGMLDYINSRGLTVKKEETPTTTTTQPKRQTVQTPKQAEWDYQDNSQARMNQIADNLNNYRQTMPQLFDDESAFYNFFIDGKGRSQDQIDFLWDYFNRVKKFGKYDNMSPEALGSGIANGTIPEDYLNNLKSTDPAKYQEVITFKQEREDAIKNESFLNDAANMAGIEGWESEPSSIQYGKWNGIWMDEDENGVDDRREHYATEEEQGYQRQIADLNAANLDIDNTVKHDYEDLVKKYPGATKATLMAMANDRNANLLREKENNLVELTRLQGYVSYMQSERQEMNQAGADSIAQLQKNLGMYYQYSPEGIAELAQAQYGATNITLDQADSGNETQKQMALQNVLDGYYDKYGDIIQRSEQQVINDVIAYAKKNGIGLAQALQENFVQPLQSKPEFATISSGRKISDGVSDKWSVTTIKNANGEDMSVMYNQSTGEIRNLGGDYVGNMGVSTPGTPSKTEYGKSYTVVSQEQLVNGLDDFLADYEIGTKGGQCGAFINNGLKKIGAITENIYTNDLQSKLGSKNQEANADAQSGWVAIYDPSKLSGNGAKYGHVGFVVKDNGDGTVAILDSNGTKNADGQYDESVGYHPSVPKSSLYGYFDPTKSNTTEPAKIDYAKVLGWIPTQLRNTDIEKQWYLDIAKEQFEKGLNPFEAAMSIIGFDITNKDAKAQSLKNKVLDIIQQQGSETMFNQSVLSSMASFINQGKYEQALQTLENQLGSYMRTQGTSNLERDSVASAMQAIDSLNNIKNYKGFVKGGFATIGELMGAEGKSTAKFQVRVNSVKKTLKSLGYDDEDIDNIVPKLTNDKATFTARVGALEDALMSQYNILRANHGLPAMDKSGILKQTPLSEIYKVGYVTVTPYQPSRTNMNLRYSISSENEAFNII